MLTSFWSSTLISELPADLFPRKPLNTPLTHLSTLFPPQPACLVLTTIHPDTPQQTWELFLRLRKLWLSTQAALQSQRDLLKRLMARPAVSLPSAGISVFEGSCRIPIAAKTERTTGLHLCHSNRVQAPAAFIPEAVDWQRWLQQSFRASRHSSLQGAWLLLQLEVGAVSLHRESGVERL